MKSKYSICAICLILSLGLTSCTSSPMTPSSSVSSKTEQNSLQDLPIASAQEILLQAGVGNVEIVLGDEASIQGENLNEDWLTVSASDTSIEVCYQPTDPQAVRNVDTSSHWIRVTLPENHSVASLSVITGTGSLDLRSLCFDQLFLSQGTGDISADSITAPVLTLECGTGTFSGNRICVSDSTQIHAGAGTVDLGGDLSGQILLEGGTGTISLHLQQPRQNYQVRSHSAVRDIYLDGTPLDPPDWEWEADDPWEQEEPETSFRSDPSSSETAANTITIDGGTGTVNLSFGS